MVFPGWCLSWPGSQVPVASLLAMLGKQREPTAMYMVEGAEAVGMDTESWKYIGRQADRQAGRKAGEWMDG